MRATAAARTADDPGAAAEDGGGRASTPIHGFLSARYTDRSRSGEHDRDLVQTVKVDVGDPATSPVTWHVLARVADDLDGRVRRGDDQTFVSLSDTKRRSLTGRVYHAFAEWHRPSESVARVRVGRQTLNETPASFSMDGVLVESTPRDDSTGLVLGGYGGVPVQEYTGSTRGDSVVGGWAEWSPWRRGSLRVDALHVEDESEGVAYEDRVVAVGLDQQVGRTTWVDAGYSILDGESRDVRLGGRYLDAGSGTSVRVTLYELLKTQTDLTAAFDPFTRVLFDEFPYRQLGVLLSKDLGRRVTAFGGVDVRRVTDDDDIGEFNRDFERTYVTCTVHDTGVEGLDASVSGEVWNSPGSDIDTWGADLGMRLDGDSRLSLGSYYSLYKYSLQAGKERDDVRTTYVAARWGNGPGMSVDLRYEYEDADTDQFHLVRIGTTWRF